MFFNQIIVKLIIALAILASVSINTFSQDQPQKDIERFPISRSVVSDKSGIVGVLVDDTGAVIPGALVTLTDLKSGSPKITTTNDIGEFVFPGLAANDYKVRIDARGFKTHFIKKLELENKQQVRLIISMESAGIVLDADHWFFSGPESICAEVNTISDKIDLPKIVKLPTVY